VKQLEENVTSTCQSSEDKNSPEARCSTTRSFQLSYVKAWFCICECC